MAVDLRLRILDADAAGSELERGALQLGDELRNLEVDDVRPLADGAAPDGTRGGTTAALGALLVSLHPTVGVLSAVVATVRAWLTRPGRGPHRAHRGRRRRAGADRHHLRGAGAAGRGVDPGARARRCRRCRVSPVREALVVAVDQYDDEGLGRLRAPADDAEALGAVLGDPRIGDFAVRVLRNESAQTIRVAVEDFFADRRPDDLLLLHFSCHGLKNAAGELYLAASDSRPDRLASTAVPADFVNRQMADSRAQRIALFLDCCYGGAFPRGMVVRAAGDVAVGDAFATQRDAGGRGRVVVTASSSVEYAFEGAELASDAQVAPSVFTGSVVAGLESGEADRDGDGWVGLNELFGYVAERVRRVTPHQTPHLWAFGSEGDLLLAHSRRRRVTAGELPAEVVEAIGSSLAATRLGVAVELRDRLLGPDLGQALAAWSALTGLVVRRQPPGVRDC